MSRTITVQELIDAAEKNGYAWRGNGSPGRYCILDQAAINLGMRPGDWTMLADALNDLPRDDTAPPIGSSIWLYNDDHATSYEDALNFLKLSLENLDLNQEIQLPTLED